MNAYRIFKRIAACLILVLYRRMRRQPTAG